MAERDPLTNLEGIDLYDRARLLDEGVTNVEGLAHYDLIELMLQTRIPAPRLVDWIDQGILYLHFGWSADEGVTSRTESLRRLRAYGIRTATDLEQAHWEATNRGQLDAFLDILPGFEGSPALPRLSVVLDTIRDEEWMTNLRYWRDPVHLVEQTVEWPPQAAAPEPVRRRPAREPEAAANGAPRERRARRASRARARLTVDPSARPGDLRHDVGHHAAEVAERRRAGLGDRVVHDALELVLVDRARA